MTDKEKSDNLNRYSRILEDVAKSIVEQHDMGPREMIAIIGVALVRSNFVHARDGKETSALEDAFRFMRALHDDMVADYVKSHREDAEGVH